MKIGIIGGGQILENPQKLEISTSYGDTSSELEKSKIENVEVYTMRRHDYNHSLPPSNINYKANIIAFKNLGIDFLIGVTATGSLQHNIKTGDVVIPDQMLDFTISRENTFSKDGNVIHESMAEPYSKKVRSLFEKVLRNYKETKIHYNKNLISIEGPHFPSNAEAEFYRLIGADIINMTTSTEAKLCKELSIPYQPISLITDDRSHLDKDNLTIKTIQNNIENKNNNTIKKIIFHIIKSVIFENYNNTLYKEN